jgi:ribonucleoside-diphosphate reductase alpha chain
LNKVIDKNYYPTEKAKYSNFKHRPIGIGVQGLADVFMILKLSFTSDESQEINKLIFETLYWGAMNATHDLVVKHNEMPYSTFGGSPLSQGLFQFDVSLEIRKALNLSLLIYIPGMYYQVFSRLSIST